MQHIKSLDIQAGVALNPATLLSTLDYILEDLDLVLVMSVNPGFGGQKFIPSALRKVRELKERKTKEKYSFTIEIDGGVSLSNVKTITDAGVELVVAGSAVFGADNIEERVKEFKTLF